MTKKEALALAERACWALLQDDIVGLSMVDDLGAHIRKALYIAQKTKDIDEAADRARSIAALVTP